MITSFDCWLQIANNMQITTKASSTLDLLVLINKELGSDKSSYNSVYDALLELRSLLTGDTDVLPSRYDILLSMLQHFESVATEVMYPTEYDILVKLVPYITAKTEFKGITLTALEDSTVVLNARNTGHIQYALENSRDWSTATRGETVTVPQGRKLYVRNYYTSAPSAPTASAENAQIYVASGDCDVHANVAEFWMYNSDTYNTHNTDYTDSARNLISGNVSNAYFYCKRSAHNGVYNYLLWSTVPCTIKLASEDPHVSGNVYGWQWAFGRCSHIKSIDLSDFNIKEASWQIRHTIHWLDTQVDEVILNQHMFDMCKDYVRSVNAIPYMATVKVGSTTYNPQPRQILLTNPAHDLTDFSIDETFANFWHIQATIDEGQHWYDVPVSTDTDAVAALCTELNRTNTGLGNNIYLRGYRTATIDGSSYTAGFNITYTDKTRQHLLRGNLCHFAYAKDFNATDFNQYTESLSRLQNNSFQYMFKDTDITELDIFAPGASYGFMSATPTYIFRYMFHGCQYLKEVGGEIKLNETNALGSQACMYMFGGCTSLVKAPELPATTLGTYCYQHMFHGCSSLVNAPELPATTLSNNCYQHMFFGCSSLVNAPELPATTLSNYCYQNMFQNCLSLVNAPALPATILTNSCYSNMFNGCSSLVNAPVLPATILTNNCYSNMFVACSSLVNAPALPMSVQFSGTRCCESMFRGTAITEYTIPAVSAITNNSFSGLFATCKSLEKVITYQTVAPSSTNSANWMSGVKEGGTIELYGLDESVGRPYGTPSTWFVVYRTEGAA